MFLETLHSVDDLRKIDPADLPRLAGEIRNYMIDVVSKNGGHLGPSLGVVDLTIALHYVFNTPDDRLIWDVGHQTYAHKILTGRKNDFLSVRQCGGLSGFPKVCESEFDRFDTGHSSTSLSLALGEAIARDLGRKKHRVIAVIGDGALTGGMSFEALNHIGHLKKDMIIILNDNEHSISRNVGALSNYLTELISGTTYNNFTRRLYHHARRIPVIGKSVPMVLDRIRMSIKNIFVPAHFFEDMGLRYFGPVDGHNIDNLINIMTRLKDINAGPKIIHVITRKGMGYRPAEREPVRFHGTGPFDPETGRDLKPKKLSYSAVAGATLAALAEKDKRVIAITAAMETGTGLDGFAKRFPSRFFDVGIAEQHAVTLAASLARNGLRPFFAVYSSFLQRGYDQLIHDVAIMGLPATFLIDRAGLVGEDGETHHGLFDVSFIRNIPGFTLLAPSDGRELRDMIAWTLRHDGPVAIRYPRGACGLDKLDCAKPSARYVPGCVMHGSGKKHLLIAAGDMAAHAHAVAAELSRRGTVIRVAVCSLIRPLALDCLTPEIRAAESFSTLENAFRRGGMGEDILASLDPALRARLSAAFAFDDEFVAHGTNEELFRMNRMDVISIADAIERRIRGRNKTR